MHLRLTPLALFAVFVLPGGVTHAQVLPPPRVVPQTAPPAQLLPSPRFAGVLPPAGRPVPTLPLAASPYPVPGYRPSAYQVWQNYGVTYLGWLRPRIIQTGYGGYWLYNGAPFPYPSVMPGQHMPSVAPAGAPGP